LKVQAQAEYLERELEFTARFSAEELAQIIGHNFKTGLTDEFVVVQGMSDLALILPDEIILIDFKSDEVDEDGLAQKTKLYRPQLKLYALALSRIYQRPVSAAWLYFLRLRKAVGVSL